MAKRPTTLHIPRRNPNSGRTRDEAVTILDWVNVSRKTVYLRLKWELPFEIKEEGASVLACSICGKHETEIQQISRVTYIDGREAHFCLDCFVGGAVNEGAILLLGPATVGKTSFCKTFARIVLESGRPIVYLPSSETAENVRGEFNRAFVKSYGEAQPLGEDNELRILDYYSALMGKKAESKYCLTSLANLTELSITLKAAWDGLAKSCLVVDDLTTIAQEAGEDVTLKFLRQLLAKIKGMQALGLFSMTTGILEQRFQNALLTMFDGIFEMKIQDGPEGMERFIRIYSLRGQKHSTKWTRFEITDEGIAMLPVVQSLGAEPSSA
jgi:KaiC/GvpD/RAD55 family RecA-like ATPase